MTPNLTSEERDYLRSQTLGRLAPNWIASWGIDPEATGMQTRREGEGARP